MVYNSGQPGRKDKGSNRAESSRTTSRRRYIVCAQGSRCKRAAEQAGRAYTAAQPPRPPGLFHSSYLRPALVCIAFPVSSLISTSCVCSWVFSQAKSVQIFVRVQLSDALPPSTVRKCCFVVPSISPCARAPPICLCALLLVCCFHVAVYRLCAAKQDVACSYLCVLLLMPEPPPSN